MNECPVRDKCDYYALDVCNEMFYRDYCAKHERKTIRIPLPTLKQAERQLWEERNLVERLRMVGGL